MEKKTVTIGMAGAGRATQLHMEAFSRVRDITPCFKKILAKHIDHAQRAKTEYGFLETAASFEELLADPDIEVIDICTPPYVHTEMILQALKAGKHVICEKPLTGYFGKAEDQKPIGKMVSKRKMFQELLESMDEIKKAVECSDRKFMYAENFIYAPAIQKMAEIITKKKSRILCLKGEESLKGSSSHVAGEWDKTGGGTFTRTGSHPLSAVLWLKQVEAKARQVDIKVESIMADMGYITNTLSEYDHRHIAAKPNDVEDFGTAVITFSDQTKAIIMATDTLLGGSRNYVEAYCNDAALKANLTLNNLMSTYFLDEERLDDVYISEMLPSKTGWNHPFVLDEIIRGYSAEMQDFMEAVAYDREPVSGFQIAYDTAKITYAAYLSAEEGRRVVLDDN
ncbi:MAG: Gfo/Idh/MocA family oxidoreductase [Clostridiales bacterium]|nr:Gfo/Idh/MocA family oxidoreductase [Clostridiales bacterium]